jgi:hypothetical protein
MDALEETSPEKPNFLVATHVITQNQEIKIRNKDTMKHFMLTWEKLLQALWMKILAQVQP